MRIVACFIVAYWLVAGELYVWLYRRGYNRGLAAPPDPPAIDTATFTDYSPFGILDGEQSFEDMARAYEAQQVKPYDYWRQQWEQTGDLDALHQMERFVEDT